MQARTPATPIYYPESDGEPMADNTRQFRWITLIVEALADQYHDQNVFVAGDLFWYPIENDNKARLAPDAMVVFGRPPGDRGSYLQWNEGGIAPQVVFEVQSPSNSRPELAKKRVFYEQHGVEEYYEVDPDRNQMRGWSRVGDKLVRIADLRNWRSPRLGITFHWVDGKIQIWGPDDVPFPTPQEVRSRLRVWEIRAEFERRRAEREEQRADAEQQRAEEALRQLDEERANRERLIELLRANGINTEAIDL